MNTDFFTSTSFGISAINSRRCNSLLTCLDELVAPALVADSREGVKHAILSAGASLDPDSSTAAAYFAELSLNATKTIPRCGFVYVNEPRKIRDCPLRAKARSKFSADIVATSWYRAIESHVDQFWNMYNACWIGCTYLSQAAAGTKLGIQARVDAKVGLIKVRR